MTEPPKPTLVCPWWLIRSFDNPLRHLIHNPERILAGMVPSGSIVADIGCGIGYFTIPMARQVGPTGLVYAVDLQPHMLQGVQRRARRSGLHERIRIIQAFPDTLQISATLDFALTFWMLHEVPDQLALLRQVFNLLRSGGKYLLVEPVIHVSAQAFRRSVTHALTAGFHFDPSVKINLSHATLFTKPRGNMKLSLSES
jgi:ubiquinone/menaquinone biosynthesis C-methylase UbiE